MLLLVLWLLLRRPRATEDEMAHRQALTSAMAQQAQRIERVEGELRREIGENARGGRQEIQQTLGSFQESLTRQSSEATRTQNAQLDGFSQQLMQLRGTLGDTLTHQLQAISLGMGQQAAEATRTQNAQIDAFAQQLVQLRTTLSDTLVRQLQDMSESNARRLAEVRTTLDGQLTQLQQSNAAKLDEMRATVDEKLQSTLQARLGESFKQVADRLEQVHKGLGEMQTLAQGVGDLKHLLTNVKTRGMFGEAQLARVAGAGVRARPVSPPRWPPGRAAATWWTSRSACRGATPMATLAGCRSTPSFPTKTTSACSMRSSAPMPKAPRRRRAGWSSASSWKPSPWPTNTWSRRTPPTSRSCFCPPKGLYAEVLRRPGLMEVLQREYRVTLAGPTTLMAMLNSLQMGFRTLALEKRSSEVWQVLGAVKTEFGKFGDVLAKVKSQTQTVLNTLDSAETRSRAMSRALKTVEALPQDQAKPGLAAGRRRRARAGVRLEPGPARAV